MFDDEVYEVTRDDFKGFIDQIKPECFTYEEYQGEIHELKVISMDGSRHFASIKQLIPDEDVHYYIYDMPHEDERRAGHAVRKITLTTPDEVKAFFNVLNKLQKGEINDRNLS